MVRPIRIFKHKTADGVWRRLGPRRSRCIYYSIRKFALTYSGTRMSNVTWTPSIVYYHSRKNITFRNRYPGRQCCRLPASRGYCLNAVAVVGGPTIEKHPGRQSIRGAHRFQSNIVIPRSRDGRNPKSYLGNRARKRSLANSAVFFAGSV